MSLCDLSDETEIVGLDPGEPARVSWLARLWKSSREVGQLCSGRADQGARGFGPGARVHVSLCGQVGSLAVGSSVL